MTALPGSDYPPILDMRGITSGVKIGTAGKGGTLDALPFEVQHGNIKSLGFRLANLAYTPDINDVPFESLQYLENLDTWIVDALRPKPHPSHFSLPETLAWIARLKPKQAILTNMHVDMDYATLLAELPPNIVPAFDGMVVDF